MSDYFKNERERLDKLEYYKQVKSDRFCVIVVCVLLISMIGFVSYMAGPIK